MKDDNWFIDDSFGATVHGEWSVSEGFDLVAGRGGKEGFSLGKKIPAKGGYSLNFILSIC